MRRFAPELELIADAGNFLGESAVWNAADGALHWINCQEPAEVLTWSAGRPLQRLSMPQRIGGLVLKAGGGAICALADGLYDLDLADGTLSRRVASPITTAALHEAACDRQGRLWVGSFDLRISQENMAPGGGSLFRLDGERLTPVLEGISCSNGLCFSPDGTTLYHTDSTTGIVFQWDLHPTDGTLGNQREFFRFNPASGVCDGATVDTEGGYWAAFFPGGLLRRYLPDGTLDLEVQMPFSSPTKPAFMGPELDTLCITTSTMIGFGPGTQMLGSVWSFRPGVKGLPEPLFRA